MTNEDYDIVTSRVNVTRAINAMRDVALVCPEVQEIRLKLALLEERLFRLTEGRVR